MEKTACHLRTEQPTLGRPFLCKVGKLLILYYLTFICHTAIFILSGSKSEPGLIPRSVKHIFNCVGSAIDDNPRIAPLNYKQAQIRNAKDRLLNDQIKASIINSTVSPV